MAQLPAVEVKGIENYVNSQIRDDDNKVKLVQKVGSRRIASTSYDLYDVWMEEGDRWWVITDPTNLYSQEEFNDVNMAFTYHLGLRVIIFERDKAKFVPEEDDDEEGEPEPAWYVPTLRRYQGAVEVMAAATDAEDFQAVGIRCRETLLSFVRHGKDAEWVPEQDQPPQVGNFKAWAGIFAEALATGKHRSYLKAIADKTWDLTVWLQHYADATEWDAEVVLSATRHFLMSMALAHRHYTDDPPKRCPRCDSYRLREDGDLDERDGVEGWWSQPVCLGCDWRGEEKFEPFPPDHAQRMADYLAAAEAKAAERAQSGEEL